MARIPPAFSNKHRTANLHETFVKFLYPGLQFQCLIGKKPELRHIPGRMPSRVEITKFRCRNERRKIISNPIVQLKMNNDYRTIHLHNK